MMISPATSDATCRPKRRVALDDPFHRLIARLWGEGLSARQIAGRLGCRPTDIDAAVRLMRQHDLTLARRRSPGSSTRGPADQRPSAPPKPGQRRCLVCGGAFKPEQDFRICQPCKDPDEWSGPTEFAVIG